MKSRSIILLYISVMLLSCNKLIEIAEPTSSITSSEVFSKPDQADAAVVGLYYSMSTSNDISFMTGMLTMYAGLSADELTFYDPTNVQIEQFEKNQLVSNNGICLNLWTQGFSYINSANSIIENIDHSLLTDSVKRTLSGEALFLRSLSYFYLTNLFGDLPAPMTSNWRNTYQLSRSSREEILKSITNDLTISYSYLPGDYAKSGGQRTRANKWSAAALLARVSLFKNDWQNAADQASKVIDSSSLFSLTENPNETFLSNSSEAILQFESNPSQFPYNLVFEGLKFIPPDLFTRPILQLSDSLLSQFEPGDARRTVWIDSTTIDGITYRYPFKYFTKPTDMLVNANPLQYYTVLRLAELYLIRAEAYAQIGTNLAGAAADLNTVRIRAGLPPTTASTKEDLINAIEHERQTELFAEWGHRWLDLKRNGTALTKLAYKNDGINTNMLLYPIPSSELTLDPNLTQNTGY